LNFPVWPKNKILKFPRKMSPSQGQKKLEIKIEAQNHTNIHFCIQGLSISWFFNTVK